jgi:hypothetical protein
VRLGVEALEAKADAEDVLVGDAVVQGLAEKEGEGRGE